MMKVADDVSGRKLRGGFYTPPGLVEHCLNRVRILNGHQSAELLEPSAGDGAFIKGIATHALSTNIHRLMAVEIEPSEAEKCRTLASSVPFDMAVSSTSFLSWLVISNDKFDISVGNPPFVRYQFIEDGDARDIEILGRRLGISFQGVSNLWIPIFIGALNRLRSGGTFAFVVPAELFTGVSAGVARLWLLENIQDLQVDLFDSGSFPDVLQEVIVVSGRRRDTKLNELSGSTRVTFVEHAPTGHSRWKHDVPVGKRNWTRFLLRSDELQQLEVARQHPTMVQLGSIASVEVSTVTGANAFFSLTSSEARSWQLEEWTLPLLARIRQASGLVFSVADHSEMVNEDAKAWFLYFDEARRSPAEDAFATAYIEKGEKEGLHRRYKTSIRDPWYRVPLVKPRRLLLSKRCHGFPRLVLNEAQAVTTDTIYQGDLLPMFAGRERDLVAGFHNSLTLLDAELEGRSFGGGVLELVPSEISRLSVPLVPGFEGNVAELDRLCRSTPGSAIGDELIEKTNEMLSGSDAHLSINLLGDLEGSRRKLQQRRLRRNR